MTDDLDLMGETVSKEENQKRIQSFVEALSKLTTEHGILLSTKEEIRVFNIRRPSDGVPMPGRYYFCPAGGFAGRIHWLAE